MIIDKRKYLLRWWMSLIALLLASCGTATQTAAPAAPSPTTKPIKAHADLIHAPNGQAELTWNQASKQLKVFIMMGGLAPNSTHPTELRTGSCDHPGPLLYALKNTESDDAGNGSMTSIIEHVAQDIPASGWYLVLHNGPLLQTADQKVMITCGNVSKAGTPQSVQVSLGTSIDKDQAASGSVDLTLIGDVLTVKITMVGLEPNSDHPAHLHGGTCAKQGDVVQVLNDVVADATGHATTTTTIPGMTAIPDGGWYVNVHFSTDLTTRTGADSITCGNVIKG